MVGCYSNSDIVYAYSNGGIIMNVYQIRICNATLSKLKCGAITVKLIEAYIRNHEALAKLHIDTGLSMEKMKLTESARRCRNKARRYTETIEALRQAIQMYKDVVGY